VVARNHNWVVLGVIALALVTLELVALAVDLNAAHSGRTEAQAVAAAAALSAASAFVENPGVTEAEIKAKAVAAANANEIMGKRIAISPADVSVDMAFGRVTVRVNHQVNTFLARTLGIEEMTIGVVAVAEASLTPAGPCLKPFEIPATALPLGEPCMA